LGPWPKTLPDWELEIGRFRLILEGWSGPTSLGAVHVQHYPLWRIDGLGLGDEFAIDAGQATEVVLLGQHLGLKSLQAGGQRRTTFPLADLLRQSVYSRIAGYVLPAP
jgi:hypothetical protein